MIKRLAMALLALSFVFASNVRALADDDKAAEFTREKLTAEDAAIKYPSEDVSGTTPLVSGLGNQLLESEINDRVDAFFQDELTLGAETAESFYFSFDVKTGGTNGEIISILLYSTRTAGSSAVRIASVNYNEQTEKFIDLTNASALGPNGVKLANKFILDEIQQNPEKYNSSFSGITADHDFAVDDDTVVILFDEFEIAPGSDSVAEFRLPRRNIVNRYFGKDTYYTQKQSLYNLKMIELNTVAREFGYNLVWDGVNRTVFIYRDGALVTTLNIGVNEYNKGKMPKRALEAAPEIRGDRTQVPISFFDEILNQSYSVDSDGTITFSEYVSK